MPEKIDFKFVILKNIGGAYPTRRKKEATLMEKIK